MKHIYLNRWGIVFHAFLTTVAEEEDRVLASRVCTSLDEAWRLIEGWQLQFAVADHDVHDNSQLDLSKLLKGIEPEDFLPGNN